MLGLTARAGWVGCRLVAEQRCRWMDWALRRQLFRPVPWFGLLMVSRRLVAQGHAQGTGRHGAEQQAHLGRTALALQALHDVLGDASLCPHVLPSCALC